MRSMPWLVSKISGAGCTIELSAVLIKASQYISIHTCMDSQCAYIQCSDRGRLVFTGNNWAPYVISGTNDRNFYFSFFLHSISLSPLTRTKQWKYFFFHFILKLFFFQTTMTTISLAISLIISICFCSGSVRWLWILGDLWFCLAKKIFL